MFTIALAFIAAKYQTEFGPLYIGTVIVDYFMWQTISNIFSKTTDE